MGAFLEVSLNPSEVRASFIPVPPRYSEHCPFPHWLRYLGFAFLLIRLSAVPQIGTPLHFLCLHILCNLNSELIGLPNYNYLCIL